jgi:NAD(P)-dependent dehydrogenase (short-subunit alcohol dehydrogenase family)
VTTNPFSLEGKTALVTGGSRGIGYAIARAYIEAGARVVISARGKQALEEAAAALGANAIARACDVSDVEALKGCVEDAWRLGPIDILVNNAGISPYFKRVEHVTLDDYQQVMDVNLRGAYFASADIAVRCHEAKRPASIINISSMLGQVPLARQGVYCATKAALDQFTRVMALEWADRGIRVNAIAPGWVQSDMIDELFASRHGATLTADVPLGRIARPDEIAGLAVYLASDAASYVTGAIIPVDGGRQLR